MDDIQKQLWKQDQDFKDLLRLYAFLAEDMIFHGRYRGERMRSDLEQIVRTCGVAESQPWWNEFGGKSAAVAHDNLRKWWVNRKVLPSAIEALDVEYRAFMEGVEQDRRDRLAGVPRPRLVDLLNRIGV